MELFENDIFDTMEVGKFSSLKAIHKYLFEDIYDFAGNVKEFTKETYLLTGVVHRGGSYKEQGTEYAVGSRHSEHAYSNICKSEDIGFRVVMYIK